MTLEASQLIADAVSAGQSTPDIIIAGADGDAGRNGHHPTPVAPSGLKGDNAKCNWQGCIRQAVNGAPGAPGMRGADGQKGDDGGDAPAANISIGLVQGIVFVFGSGGSGGDGGNGAEGGRSGDGGEGGSGDSWGAYRAHGANGGDSLDAGNGGNGGNGGHGGQGSLVTIQCDELAPQSEFVPGTAPGTPGSGGQGGQGGSPGLPGRAGYRGRFYGNRGNPGKPGSPGKDGNAGAPSTFRIKQNSGKTVPKGQKSITVAPGEIYPVTTSDRTFDTVTIQQGGILSIQTSRLVTIGTLVKVTGPPASKSASPSKPAAKPRPAKARNKSKATGKRA
jgi:hypothetical protein